MLNDRALLEYFRRQAAAAAIGCFPANRLDNGISEGIVRAAVELQATHVVMGWSGRSETAHYFMGAIEDKLLHYCRPTVLVTRFVTPSPFFRKIIVLTPRYAEHEIGFHTWLSLLRRIWRSSSAEVTVAGNPQTLDSIAATKAGAELGAKNYRQLDHVPDMNTLAAQLSANDLLVVISARHNGVSYNRKLSVMPRVVSRYFSHTNSILLYPEQPDAPSDNLGATFGRE
jgi:hypothetical protein